MALSESEWGFGPSIIDRAMAKLVVTRQGYRGPARLHFLGGRSCAVDAGLVLLRSSLASAGEGYFHCAAEIGFEALNSNDWLTLIFASGTKVEIDVLEAKSSNGSCRCLFEVKS